MSALTPAARSRVDLALPMEAVMDERPKYSTGFRLMLAGRIVTALGLLAQRTARSGLVWCRAPARSRLSRSIFVIVAGIAFFGLGAMKPTDYHGYRLTRSR